MPPRHLKSICVSVAWPAWMLCNNPSAKFLVSSYSEKLSLKHSVDCRLIVESPWYQALFPEVRLVKDQNEKSKFVTSRRGHRIATSTGGTATGEGGDYLIVDDPHNVQTVNSNVERNKTNEWFNQVFSTRLNNKKTGVIVLVMQRLHSSDLTGALLEMGGWEHLKLPCIAESKCTYDFGKVKHKRKIGDFIQPEREGLMEINQAKKTLGSYGFSAQYQQEPVPVSGGMIEKAWVKRYTKQPDFFDRVVQSWDTAYKPGDLNDPSVCTTWGITNNGYYLIDVWRKRVTYPALKEAVLKLSNQHNPHSILVEDKASGQSLIQDLQSSTKLPLIPIIPKHDKLIRMSNQSAKFEAGKISIPQTAPWLLDFEKELFSFPKSEHDDQIDTISQFLSWVQEHNSIPFSYTPVKKYKNNLWNF